MPSLLPDNLRHPSKYKLISRVKLKKLRPFWKRLGPSMVDLRPPNLLSANENKSRIQEWG